MATTEIKNVNIEARMGTTEDGGWRGEWLIFLGNAVSIGLTFYR